MVLKRVFVSSRRMSKDDLIREYRKWYYPRSTCIAYVVSNEKCQVVNQNWICSEGTSHAEMSCINQITKWIDRDETYIMKWYMSWTPCSDCSDKVIEFLKDYTNVRLRIIAARIYYHDNEDNKRGLRSLNKENVKLSTMKWTDYLNMWHRFIYIKDDEDIEKWELFTGMRGCARTNWRWTLDSILKDNDEDSELENALSHLYIQCSNK
uniref:APOBEC-3C n=1 Tax=Protopterus annectens TaxID=7888 RepID=A0A0M3WMQ3_PROAN|nr:APOBEC-3C [Protopterus annectens]